MAVNDVYKLSVVGVYGLGQQFVNTFHYQQTEATSDPPAQALAEAWDAQVTDAYLDLLLSSSLVQTIEVRQVTGSPLGYYDLAVSRSGTQTGEQLPPQSAPLISWRTAVLGRRNRGRTYLPAPAESMQAAGVLETTYTDLAAAFVAVMFPISVGATPSFDLVIYGAANPDVDPPLAENIVPVVSAIVRGDIATQRRRRVGTGS